VGSYHETRLPIPSAHTRRPFLICAVLSLSWWGIHNNATDTKGKVSVAHQKEATLAKRSHHYYIIYRATYPSGVHLYHVPASRLVHVPSSFLPPPK